LAKEGLLTLGLAPLGALLLGPAGALAGWALSSLRKLRQSKTQGLGPRLKQALPALALAGGVAATGALIGPWGAAALALSSVALPAATSWVESSRRDPQVRIDPQAFTRAYVDKVQQALARVQPELSLQVELGTPQLQMQSVLSACQAAANHLPGGMALQLAGQAAQQLLSPRDVKLLDQLLLRRMPEMAPPHADSPDLEGLAQLRYAQLPPESPAVATNEVVVLDANWARSTDPVTRDLVVGHELSHIRHHDALFKLGAQALQQSMALNGANPVMVGLAQLAVQSMMAGVSREMELRADQEGFAYALRQGHSPDQIGQAAERLFAGSASAPGALDTHPPNSLRIGALKERANHDGSLQSTEQKSLK
jgi:Zn-dependent protease with chaperone function